MINLRYFYNRCIICNYTSIDYIIRNYCSDCHKSIDIVKEQPDMMDFSIEGNEGNNGTTDILQQLSR